MKLTSNDIEAAGLGGAVLGGGGGGSLENGRQLGKLAMQYGGPNLVEVTDLPKETLLATCSYVGSPAARHICVRPQAYTRAVELLQQHFGVAVGGLITNECGGTATLNGWMQAAALGLPLVDAPCNGRAHPTGVMGSMGLHAVDGYVSRQAATGGDETTGRYVEISVSGSLDAASGLVRQAAVQAGGMVAVARNPVDAGYVRDHAACGAIRMCIELGQAMLDARPRGGRAVSEAVVRYLDGEIVTAGPVNEFSLRSTGGFDVGQVCIGEFQMDFWNEYMTLERGTLRLATFPDLIMTLSEDGMPITTAQVQAGHHLTVIRVPWKNLRLGAGMFHRELYTQAEKLFGKPIWEPAGLTR